MPIAAVFALAIFIAALPAFPVSPARASTTARAPCAAKPIVAKIHAEWCASCRATQPTWEKIVTDLSEEATMITFDVTDRASYTAAVAAAERLEISAFLSEFRRRTGTIAVLDCNTKKPLLVLSGERDFDPYRDAVLNAAKGSMPES